MSEFALIARHFTRAARSAEVELGIGDDAAILRAAPGLEWLCTVDMMVEGRHFLPGTDPGRLGRKLMAVNLSDIAAMGGRPRFALLAAALPEADDAWLAAFAEGLFAMADAHGVDVVGGDTTRGPRNLCLTLMGDVPAGTALRRDGARAGDDLWVSGTLGDAMMALAAMEGRSTLDGAALAAARQRLEAPEPRVALGQRLRGVASAAIDVSDGIVGDLGHILERSQVGATLQLDRLPCSPALEAELAGAGRDAALEWLLAGGDDYELCFCAPPSRRADVEAAATASGTRVTRVGAIEAAPGLRLRDGEGRLVERLPRAFDHFGGPHG